MAWREARAAWRRLLLFFLALALGVGAIVVVRALVGGVRDTLRREARGLLGGDVLVQTNRALDDAQRAALERLLGAPEVRGRVRARTQVVTTTTMARAARDSAVAPRLVELRGVERDFPLYGRVELADGTPYTLDLLRDRGALVAPELLAALDLRVGDELVLGGATFRVRGVVSKEPGRRPSAFSFGPRALVSLDDLRQAGLLAFGSRALHQLLLRVDEPAVAPLERALNAEFAAQYVSVHTLHSSRGRGEEGLQRAESFLSLVGFAILVLGGVGVASVVRVFVQERLPSLAVLKCLGASGRQVLAVDLAQVLLLGLLGSACGLGLARLALAAVPRDAAQALGVEAFTLPVAVALQGLAVGLAVALLFSLPPLLAARRVKPLLLLRHDDARPARRDPAEWLAFLALGAGLVGLAAWQAGSWRVGALAAAGFGATALALMLLGSLFVRLAASAGRRARFPLRQALLRLGRPGNHTRPVLLAVGLGTFFILTVVSLQSHLVEQLALEQRADAPDLFLIDVQPDQRERVAAAVARTAGRAPRLLPVLRLRVTAVRGRDVRLEGFEQVRGRGSLGREFVVTWRDRLEPNETLLAGEFPARATPAGVPTVSIEQGLRARYGIQLGDELRFDVLGRALTARVASVRAVDWADARSGGFMFVFPPGTFAGAPETYLGFVRAPEAAPERARLQRELAAEFPNVSSVDLRDVLRSVAALAGQVSRAVSAVGGLTLVSGVLILLGAVAVTRHERRYEAAVLCTLGARTRGIVLLLACEYAALGALAGGVGALLATAFDALAVRELLEATWTPRLGLALGGVALTALGVATVGLLASIDVLRRKPLAVLRAE
jgi:putative ABC transport system permease protein